IRDFEMCHSSEPIPDGLNRRGFLGGACATLLAGQVEGGAQKVEKALDDPTVEHGKVMFKHGGKETIDGYLARPKAQGRYPAVLVIAGNRITEEYIPHTCAALAVAGFVGLAPNIFHLLPETARTPAEMR